MSNQNKEKNVIYTKKLPAIPKITIFVRETRYFSININELDKLEDYVSVNLMHSNLGHRLHHCFKRSWHNNALCRAILMHRKDHNQISLIPLIKNKSDI